jgi:hypothetical protein
VDSGAGYLYFGGSGFPKGEVTNPKSSASLCFESYIQQALYTSAVVVADFDGNSEMDLVLTGPRDTSIGYHAGAVEIFPDVLASL